MPGAWILQRTFISIRIILFIPYDDVIQNGDIHKAFNEISSKEDLLAVSTKVIEVVLCNDNTYFYTNLPDLNFVNDPCDSKAPTESNIKSICDSMAIREKPSGRDAEWFEYGFEKRLMLMAGVDLEKDDRDIAVKKLQCFWDKYKTRFKCDTAGFDLTNGSVLKYAISHGFPNFLHTLVSIYGLDINFIDSADGLNLLDYLYFRRDKAMREEGPNHTATRSYQAYIDEVKGLGGISNKY